MNPEVQLDTDWIVLPNGQQRFSHLWSPTDSTVGHIVIVHGLGEHGGRYVRLAPHLVKHGYRVSSIDLQGHGQSPGKRGVIADYDSLLDDVAAAIARALQVDPQLPIYLFGHSMGGNLAANYLLRRQPSDLTAAILSSPMFISPREPKGLKNLLARTALKLIPQYTLAAGTETRYLMDDPVEQELLDNDALFHRRISLRLGAALIDSGRWALENAQQLSIPTLVTHGLEDRICLPEGSIRFAEAAGQQCQLRLMEKHMHESFRDQRRHHVIGHFVDFLRDHTRLHFKNGSRADSNDAP